MKWKNTVIDNIVPKSKTIECGPKVSNIYADVVLKALPLKTHQLYHNPIPACIISLMPKLLLFYCMIFIGQ